MESGKSTPISAASLDALAKRRLSMASRGPGRGQHEALATARSVIEIMESDGMKLEDSINLSHLVRLMKIFNEADENGSDGLDIDEFRNAFGEILGKGKDAHEMNILFMKIDTNCDGTIDWDELCTYMLLEYQEKHEMGSETNLPFPRPLKLISLINSLHRDAIMSVCWLQTIRSNENKTSSREGRYVTVGRDGIISFWTNEMKMQKSLTLDYPKPKFMWVTDCLALNNANKIAVATTDSDICFYDLSAGHCERRYHICSLPNAVQHMDYWIDPVKSNHSILVFGDSGGNVGVFRFYQATLGLFAIKKQDVCVRIPFAELLAGKRSVLCTADLYENVHGDWSKKVNYCRNLDAFLSCSWDSDSALVLGHMDGRNDRTSFRLTKGVSSFDYSEEWNCIVTGGVDRLIRVWSPYVSHKPTAVLKGHNAAIFQVIICDRTLQLYTLSKDKVLKVWDLRDHSCIQTITRLQSLGHGPLTTAFLDGSNHTLFMAANQLGALDMGDHDQSDAIATSHEKPICAALFNANFGQVVSGCADSTVRVWDLETGEKVMQFGRAHGNAEITAMAFDPTERRLVTGARDGTVKMWNFNNGACLGVIDSLDSTEITGIVCPSDRICTAGWGRRIVVHGDLRGADEEMPSRAWRGRHVEDILCMDYCAPNLVATGSYNGDILVWGLDNENVYCHFNRRENICKTIMKGMTAREFKLKSVTARRSLAAGAGIGGGDGDGDETRKRRTSSVTRLPSLVENDDDDKKRLGNDRDDRAVEKLVFLKSRENDAQTATLVASGGGGWIYFWSVFGGGVLGEFVALHRWASDFNSIYALATDPTNTIFFTGCTQGYVKIWDISTYCLDPRCHKAGLKTRDSLPMYRRLIESKQRNNLRLEILVKRPATQSAQYAMPPHLASWRAHLHAINSIDFIPEKDLVLTASSDCSIRLWTVCGRYVGTFGQKTAWVLPHPSKQGEVPQHLPKDVLRVASQATVKTTLGTLQSKWKLARSLFATFHLIRRSRQESAAARFKSGAHLTTLTEIDLEKSDILGKSYKRKIRHRCPPAPPRIWHDRSNQYFIYPCLKCHDLVDVHSRFKMLSQSRRSSLRQGEAVRFENPWKLSVSEPPPPQETSAKGGGVFSLVKALQLRSKLKAWQSHTIPKVATVSKKMKTGDKL